MIAPDLFTPPPAGLALREYQHYAIAKVDAALVGGSRAPLLVAPTGSGKTVIATELVRREVEAGGRVLFLAPRRELISQASRKLRDGGVPHGVILAGADHLHDIDARAQVASLDTLLSRVLRQGKLSELPDFTMVIIDEAHLVVTTKRIELLDRWPNAIRIGLTATPIRKDGRALGLLFDRLVEVATIEALTEAGHLVPVRYFSLSTPDLRRVRITAGEYNSRELDAVINRPALVGDVVTHWLRHAADRRTVVFCTSIPHSIAVAEAFQRAGVAAEHVDAGTPIPEREETFVRFRRGDTQVLTNCFLASYGFDLPALSCIVLARPTKSLMLYLQMIGRGLRPADNKHDCLVLDHSGSVHMHGFAHERRAWTLAGHECLATRGGHSSKTGVSEARQIDCPNCPAVFTGTMTCPECGDRILPRGRDVEALDGDLVEVGKKREPAVDCKTFYSELRTIADERHFSQKWAAAQFRERFGMWPPWSWNSQPKLEPSMTTRRWVKSRLIAYAKRKAPA